MMLCFCRKKYYNSIMNVLLPYLYNFVRQTFCLNGDEMKERNLFYNSFCVVKCKHKIAKYINYSSACLQMNCSRFRLHIRVLMIVMFLITYTENGLMIPSLGSKLSFSAYFRNKHSIQAD
jgi:hypothetical protein